MKILLAQAKSEGMELMTHDSLIPYYTITIIAFYRLKNKSAV